MNLLIDIGNTLVKLSVTNRESFIHTETVPDITEDILQRIVRSFPDIKKAIWVSVRKGSPSWLAWIKGTLPKVIQLNYETAVPIKIRYETPETLGMDRVAGLAGAWSLFPGKRILVIDAGTAITYDVLSSKGEFEGGNISPGIGMRFRALHQLTGKLPLVENPGAFDLYGRNTHDAIASGVLRGVLSEATHYIEQVRKEDPNSIIIISGGDANFFGKNIKSAIFVNQNIVSIGLDNILEFNTKEL